MKKKVFLAIATMTALTLSGCSSATDEAASSSDDVVAVSCRALLDTYASWSAGRADVSEVIGAATQTVLDMADAGLAPKDSRGDDKAPFGDDLYTLALDMSAYYRSADELGIAVPFSETAPAAIDFTDRITPICDGSLGK